MRQKLRSSYINIFASNRRKLNSKKGLCGDPRLDMLFRTKKRIKYIECRLEREKSDRRSKNHELRKIEKHFHHPRQNSIFAKETSNGLKFGGYVGTRMKKLW